MEKVIYLDGVMYRYTEIKELRSALESCDISIGENVRLGNYVFLYPGVEIGDNVNIGTKSIIKGGTKIENYCVINSLVVISQYVTIRSESQIGDSCKIESAVWIGSNVNICAQSIIGRRAMIEHNVNLVKSLYIKGSYHPVTYCGNGMLSIGCHHRSIEFWENEYEHVGWDEGYTEAQRKEYAGYIQIAKLFHEQNYSK